MKRIFYGNITLTVSTDVADAVFELSQFASDRVFYRPEFANGMSRSVPYARGGFEEVTLSAYLNDEEVISEVTLVLGGTSQIAIASTTLDRVEPVNSNAELAKLRATIAEYGDDE